MDIRFGGCYCDAHCFINCELSSHKSGDGKSSKIIANGVGRDLYGRPKTPFILRGSSFLHENVFKLKEKQRAQLYKQYIGFVFQQYHLIDELTVYENIETPLIYQDVKTSERKALVEQVTHFEESFRAAEIRFQNGVINATEFLIVKNNLDRAKINVTQTKYEHIFRTKLLDFYQGKKY